MSAARQHHPARSPLSHSTTLPAAHAPARPTEHPTDHPTGTMRALTLPAVSAGWQIHGSYVSPELTGRPTDRTICISVHHDAESSIVCTVTPPSWLDSHDDDPRSLRSPRSVRWLTDAGLGAIIAEPFCRFSSAERHHRTSTFLVPEAAAPGSASACRQFAQTSITLNGRRIPAHVLTAEPCGLMEFEADGLHFGVHTVRAPMPEAVITRPVDAEELNIDPAQRTSGQPLQL